MDLIARFVPHVWDEIQMGRVYWFQPANGCDAISATANTGGFTPLLAIASYFDWDRVTIEEAARSCNERNEICVVPVHPPLLLVPATEGQGDAEFLMRDLVSAAEATGVKGLHFTHFGFLQRDLPPSEGRCPEIC